MPENDERRYIKPLKDPGAIAAFARAVGCRFPDDFRAFAAAHNGARPKRRLFCACFKAEKNVRVFKKLLSFNEDDPENIWNIRGWQREWDKKGGLDRYVAFAEDPGGNMICFHKTDGKVAYVNLEYDELSKMLETVADSFTEFVESLFAAEGS